jgi:hypothetical protein
VLVVHRVGNRRKTRSASVPIGRRVVEIGSGHQIILPSAASALTAPTCKSRKLFGMSHFHKLTEILQASRPQAPRQRRYSSRLPFGRRSPPELLAPARARLAASAGLIFRGIRKGHRAVHRPRAHGVTCGQGPCASGPPRTWSRAGPTALARNGRSGIIALRTSGHPTSVAFGERRRLGSPLGELLCAVIGPAPGIRCVIGGGAPLINNRLEPTES